MLLDYKPLNLNLHGMLHTFLMEKKPFKKLIFSSKYFINIYIFIYSFIYIKLQTKIVIYNFM